MLAPRFLTLAELEEFERTWDCASICVLSKDLSMDAGGQFQDVVNGNVLSREISYQYVVPQGLAALNALRQSVSELPPAAIDLAILPFELWDSLADGNLEQIYYIGHLNDQELSVVGYKKDSNKPFELMEHDEAVGRHQTIIRQCSQFRIADVLRDI